MVKVPLVGNTENDTAQNLCQCMVGKKRSLHWLVLTPRAEAAGPGGLALVLEGGLTGRDAPPPAQPSVRGAASHDKPLKPGFLFPGVQHCPGRAWGALWDLVTGRAVAEAAAAADGRGSEGAAFFCPDSHWVRGPHRLCCFLPPALICLFCP